MFSGLVHLPVACSMVVQATGRWVGPGDEVTVVRVLILTALSTSSL